MPYKDIITAPSVCRSFVSKCWAKKPKKNKFNRIRGAACESKHIKSRKKVPCSLLSIILSQCINISSWINMYSFFFCCFIVFFSAPCDFVVFIQKREPSTSTQHRDAVFTSAPFLRAVFLQIYIVVVFVILYLIIILALVDCINVKFVDDDEKRSPFLSQFRWCILIGGAIKKCHEKSLLRFFTTAKLLLAFAFVRFGKGCGVCLLLLKKARNRKRKHGRRQ